jgi:hypothetical protein
MSRRGVDFVHLGRNCRPESRFQVVHLPASGSSGGDTKAGGVGTQKPEPSGGVPVQTASEPSDSARATTRRPITPRTRRRDYRDSPPRAPQRRCARPRRDTGKRAPSRPPRKPPRRGRVHPPAPLGTSRDSGVRGRAKRAAGSCGATRSRSRPRGLSRRAARSRRGGSPCGPDPALPRPCPDRVRPRRRGRARRSTSRFREARRFSLDAVRGRCAGPRLHRSCRGFLRARDPVGPTTPPSHPSARSRPFCARRQPLRARAPSGAGFDFERFRSRG